MAVDYPFPVKALIAQLKRLPGIGPKSAERIAIWLMQRGGEVTGPFAEALDAAGREVRECDTCGFFSTEEEGCAVCSGAGRDHAVLCVVEQPTDILPLERSGAFLGHYHSLRGKISPLENVGPEDLRIDELVSRVREGHFAEVILAFSADVEGEATANYLVEVLSEFDGVRVTRLAHGLPVGGGLENADELTLFRALQGRVGLR
ncbi:MAG: recombination protein RecR [Verrucomicrobiae bacterium]|nr:recombination protein RecR [Verrucomicrobiae bacterium]MCB1091092.1 recombination protein RecR [Verrucomicrobiae bacterium]